MKKIQISVSRSFDANREWEGEKENLPFLLALFLSMMVIFELDEMLMHIHTIIFNFFQFYCDGCVTLTENKFHHHHYIIYNLNTRSNLKK